MNKAPIALLNAHANTLKEVVSYGSLQWEPVLHTVSKDGTRRMYTFNGSVSVYVWERVPNGWQLRGGTYLEQEHEGLTYKAQERAEMWEAKLVGSVLTLSYVWSGKLIHEEVQACQALGRCMRLYRELGTHLKYLALYEGDTRLWTYKLDKEVKTG